MKKHSVLRAALLAALAAALLGVPVLAAGEEAAAGSLYGTVWALLPPVIAITLALITKEAYSSLFIGIVVGALFAKGFSPIGALDMIVNDGLVAAISDNAGIFLFLVLLGIIVALVNAAGGSAAFGRWVSSRRTLRQRWARPLPPLCWVSSSSLTITSTASPSARSCAR